MASSKREREKQRRAYEARLQWERKQEAKRHRRNVITGAVVAGIVVIALVGWAVAAATNSVNPSTGATTNSAATAPASAAATPSFPPAEGNAPAASLSENRTWTGQVTTSAGTLDISLDGAKAPQAVASFVSLAKKGYFDKTYCHRLTTSEGFKVLQCGDPTVKSADAATTGGTGGPGYSFGPIENAPADQTYKAGTIAMARQGNAPNSNGSQFFIVYGDTVIPNDQAGGYSVFGQVTGGLDAIVKVGEAGTTTGATDGPPKTPVEIEKVSVK